MWHIKHVILLGIDKYQNLSIFAKSNAIASSSIHKKLAPVCPSVLSMGKQTGNEIPTRQMQYDAADKETN